MVRKTHSKAVFFLAALLFVSLPSLLFAAGKQPSGQEILEKMDQQINGFEDQIMEVRMTVRDTDRSEKNYDFTIWQKGRVKRLVRFTSGEFKNMATLAEDRNRVFVYLPGFKKVRRVAAHNMKQTFAGSDFSTSDMASVNWSDQYDAAIERQDDHIWTLRCTPRNPKEAVYGWVRIMVRKQDYAQTRVEYFGHDNQPIKILEASRPKKYEGGMVRNSLVRMQDAKTGHSTDLEVKSLRINQNLKDSLFSKRNLKWGR